MESHLNSKRRWFRSLIFLFTTCFRLNRLKLEKCWATVFQVNLFAIRFNLVQFRPSTLHCSFLVLDLCFSWKWNQYLLVSIYFKTSLCAPELLKISWHSPFNQCLLPYTTVSFKRNSFFMKFKLVQLFRNFSKSLPFFISPGTLK